MFARRRYGSNVLQAVISTAARPDQVSFAPQDVLHVFNGQAFPSAIGQNPATGYTPRVHHDRSSVELGRLPFGQEGFHDLLLSGANADSGLRNDQIYLIDVNFQNLLLYYYCLQMSMILALFYV